MDDHAWDIVVAQLIDYWQDVEALDVQVARACAQLGEQVRRALPPSVSRRLRRLSAAQRLTVRHTVQTLAERDSAANTLVHKLTGGASPASIPDGGNNVRIVTDGGATLITIRGSRRSVSPSLNSTVNSASPAPTFPAPSLPLVAAALDISLRPRGGTNYELTARYTAPVSMVDEDILAPPGLSITLDLAALRAVDLDPEGYGKALTKTLLADQRAVLALLQVIDRAQGAGTPLRLRLSLDATAPTLHEVRWELLQNPRTGYALALSADVLLSRYLASADATPIPPAVAEEPSALVAVAAPDGLARYGLASLDRERELTVARTALAGYQLETAPRATLSTLADQLRTGPSVLYLVCHGAQKPFGNVLYLEGDRGQVVPTVAEQFVAMVRNLPQRPRLVVLASCASAGDGDSGGAAALSIAPQLAQAGVGAVLGMHGNVTQESVAAGMPVLFSELRRHGCIDMAVAVMRNYLASRGDDWWQPALFLRLRDGLLFRPPG